MPGPPPFDLLAPCAAIRSLRRAALLSSRFGGWRLFVVLFLFFFILYPHSFLILISHLFLLLSFSSPLPTHPSWFGS
jgi:hypothetical protein